MKGFGALLESMAIELCYFGLPKSQATSDCQLWLGTYANFESDQDTAQGLPFVYARVLCTK